MKKKILIGILLVLIVIQFIRPGRNVSAQASPNEIGLHYQVPEQVQAILNHSCYDCHSNNTVYPWYTNIQPAGWLIQHDINDAKHHLNFSEFGSYSEKKAKSKFEDIEDAATNRWMPLGSYVWLHPDTKLTPEQSKVLASWAAGLK
jgi:hypothetical protein